jgi:hypothetical protein
MEMDTLRDLVATVKFQGKYPLPSKTSVGKDVFAVESTGKVAFRERSRSVKLNAGGSWHDKSDTKEYSGWQTVQMVASEA